MVFVATALSRVTLFFARIGTLIRRLINFIGSIFSFLPIVAYGLVLVAIALIGFALAFLVFNYGDQGIEATESLIRCSVTPAYQTYIEPLYLLLQRLYEPLICWWNAANWFLFGIIQDVVIPLLISCNVQQLAVDAFDLFSTVLEEIVANYILTTDFLTEPFDGTATCAAVQTVWTTWQDLACCACLDLCEALKVQPAFMFPTVLVPIPVPWALGFLSSQWGDPATCNWAVDLVNTGMAILQPILRIIAQAILLLVTMTGTVERPDFGPAADYYCSAGANWALSFENIYQDLIDGFVPITVNTSGLLGWIGSLQCLTGKAAVTALKILMHIDLVVQYPSEVFWETPLKTDIAEVLNLIGTVTLPGYTMDTANPADPIFGRTRLDDAVCVVIDYFLCDSTPPSICSDNGVSPEIFGTFTFEFICCTVRAVVSFALDLVAGLVEFTYHFTSTEDFFKYVDTGAYEQIDILKADVVRAVDCIASLFAFIAPPIGECLQDLVTLTAEVALCLAAFLFKIAVGIFTLPVTLLVFAPASPPGYLADPNRAFDDWEAILNLITGDPNSPTEEVRTIKNCLCVALNYGIQFPPFPCMGACTPVGFVLSKKRRASRELLAEMEDVAQESRGRQWAARAYQEDPLLSGFVPSWRVQHNYTSSRLTTVEGIRALFAKRAHRPLGLISSPVTEAALLDIDAFMDGAYERLWDKSKRQPSWKAPGWHQQQNASKTARLSISEWLEDPIHRTLGPDVEVTVTRDSMDDFSVNCSADPLPCFDLCCFPRTILEWWTTGPRVIARMIQSLAHGPADDWAYYRDRDFETDLFLFIDATVAPIQCVCNFLQLVLPIPDLDICAPIRVTADLAQGILKTLLNAIFAFALGMEPDVGDACVSTNMCPNGYVCCTSSDSTGCLVEGPGSCVSPPFPYFTVAETGFLRDIGTLIDLTICVVDALCDIGRAVLPIPGADICCISYRTAIVVFEIIRWLLQALVSLATIFGSGVDYFQGPNIDDLGFVVQGDVVIDALFGASGGTCNQGDGGLVLCACQLINLIVPARPCPGLPVGDASCTASGSTVLRPNCPDPDFCCIVREASFLLRDTLKFLIRVVASWFQPTAANAAIEFFFCDEFASPGDPLYTASCGKMQPIIDAAFKLISDCPCTLFGLIDDLLVQAGGSACFCGTYIPFGSTYDGGLFREIPKLVKVIITKVLQLVRNFWKKDYWKNPDPMCAMDTSTTQCSWALFFFGEIADQACAAVASVTCLVTIPFPVLAQCNISLSTWFGGIVRWAFEAIIRIVNLVVGIVDTISGNCNTDIPATGGITTAYETGCLVDAVKSVLTLPFDILIGDPDLNVNGCAGGCDKFTFVGECGGCETTTTCACDVYRLPFCGGEQDTGGGLTRRVPGIVLGFFRYLACATKVATGSNGLARVVNSIRILLSILWQLSVRLINILIALLNFFLMIFSTQDGDKCACHEPGPIGLGWVLGPASGSCAPRCSQAKGAPFASLCKPNCKDGALCVRILGKSLCTFLSVLQAFVDVLRQFFNLFNPPPQAPGITEGKRWNNIFIREDGEVPADKPLESLLYPFDVHVTDCLKDEQSDTGAAFMLCICRNFGVDVPGDLCTFDNQGNPMLTSSQITTDEITSALARMFTGASTCADLIKRCDHMTWASIPYTERFEYVNCVGKHISGHRIHKAIPVFPADFFHRSDGLRALRDNILEDAQQRRYKEREARVAREQARATRPKSAFAEDNEREQRYTRTLEDHLRRNGFRDEMIIQQTIRLDRLERKIRSQEFSDSMAKAWENLVAGKWGKDQTMASAARHVGVTTWDTVSFLYELPYGQFMSDSLTGLGDIKRDIDQVGSFLYQKGTRGLWRDLTTWEGPIVKLQRRYEEIKGKGTDLERVVNAFYEGAVYKWWTSSWKTHKNPFRPFSDHFWRVWKRQSESRTKETMVYWQVVNNVRDTWGQVKEQFTWGWKPHQLRNWEALSRPAAYLAHKLAPHIVPETARWALSPFDCDLFEGIVDTAFRVVEYCVNQFVYNLPMESRGREKGLEYLGHLTRAKNASGHFAKRLQAGDTVDWERWQDDPNSLLRPRFQGAVRRERATRVRIRDLDPRHAKRVLSMATNFDFFNWILCWIQDTFGGTFAQDLADWIIDFQAWVTNTNLDPAGCPDDVGLLYWISFVFRCDFPGNLNCSNPCAIGLKAAIPRILLIALIMLGIGVLISPLMPLLLLLIALLFVIGLPAAAWHYSPRCYLLTPAFPLGDGFSIPVWPFPVSIAFPECLMSDVKSVVDVVLNDCPLEPLASCNTTLGSGEFCLLPECMYNGPICPTCPESIDIAKCATVGIGTGIDNFVYLLYRVWPGFCDFMMTTVRGSCGFNGCPLPLGVIEYVEGLLAQFKAASDTQACRHNWCFWATVLALALPIVGILIILAAIGFIVPRVIGVIFALFGIAAATPIPTAFFPDEDEDDDDDGGVGEELLAPIGRGIQRLAGLLKEKRE